MLCLLHKHTDANEIMVIGGGEIYKLLFEKAKRIYMTRVEAEPEADTFFPSIESEKSGSWLARKIMKLMKRMITTILFRYGNGK